MMQEFSLWASASTLSEKPREPSVYYVAGAWTMPITRGEDTYIDNCYQIEPAFTGPHSRDASTPFGV